MTDTILKKTVDSVPAAETSVVDEWREPTAAVGVATPWVTVKSDALWGLLDQVAVSGTRFATTIMVAVAGSHIMGTYYLAWTIVLIALCCQESLITTPYTVFVHRVTDGNRSKFLGAYLVLALSMAALMGCSVWILERVGVFNRSVPELGAVSLVLIVALLGNSLRELGRRVELAHGRPSFAFWMDAISGGTQLLLLYLLFHNGWLSASSAWMVVGATSLVGGLWWVIRQGREGICWDLRFTLRTLRTSWKFGLWVFLGQVTAALMIAGAPWFIRQHYSEQVVGIYGACMTVMLFANPLIFGISNVLGPRACFVYRNAGSGAVRRLMTRANVFVVLLMGVFGIVVVFGGEYALQLLGRDYQGIDHIQLILVYLSLMALAFGLALNGSLFLSAVERPDVNMWGATLGAVVGLSVMAIFTQEYGPAGAAAGVCIGHVIWAVLSQLGFYWLTRNGHVVARADT